MSSVTCPNCHTVNTFVGKPSSIQCQNPNCQLVMTLSYKSASTPAMPPDNNSVNSIGSQRRPGYGPPVRKNAPRLTPEAAFNQYSYNTGSMNDVSQLQHALNALGLRLDEGVALLKFESLDEDGSGSIEYDEFLRIYDDLIKWKKSYDEYDTDGNGSMDQEEFWQAIQDLNYPLSEDSAKLLFQIVDHKKTGSISLNDYIKALSIYMEIDQTMNSLEKIDNNRSVITMKEFLSFVSRLPI